MTSLLDVPLPRRLRRVPVVPWLYGTLAERAWSWDWEDQWTRAWWPQGITWAGSLLLVSWYAKAGGSRVSVVDLETRRYGHVTLLTPDGGPLKVHAGGLAWVDGWLHVAATAKGFWPLHLDDLDVGPAVEEVAQQPSQDPGGPSGRAASEPSDDASAGRAASGRRDHPTWRARTLRRPAVPEGVPAFRWSFLDASRPAVEEVVQQPSRNPGPTHLYAGEYGRGDKTTRLARLPVTDGQPSGDLELLGPGPKGMQGVVRSYRGLLVSTSHGPWHRGDLSLVEPAERQRGRVETRRRRALPIGVEDLTQDTEGHLWTAAEHPGRRAIVCASTT